MTQHHPDTRPTDQDDQLRAIARRLRTDTWELTERWSHVAAGLVPPMRPAEVESMARFGEVPAFLAALAHSLERIADGAPLLDATDLPSDTSLRAAAGEHARRRAESGYTQRDMLAEFVALRRVLWEHFATGAGADRPTFEGERVVNLLLDNVIVEAADQFFAELTEELVQRAERDPLTGLLNRQAFTDRLGRELARARRYGRELTVAVIDLDCFKEVNDTLGHLAGDAVLKRLAVLLQTHTREQDLVGRLGGDEFAIALIEADAAAAAELVRRLRIHLSPARRQFGLPRGFGVSFGAASFPEGGDTLEQLLFGADRGMYAAKGNGRGQRMTEAGTSPELANVQVLVADDDPAVRALCRTALEREGFDVTEAADGVEAVRAALDARPDVLLLDITMPHMDGWQVAERLRQDQHTAQVPVVMLTGATDEESLRRAERAGAIDFVGKPFDPGALVSTIHRVLEEAPQRDGQPGRPVSAA